MSRARTHPPRSEEHDALPLPPVDDDASDDHSAREGLDFGFGEEERDEAEELPLPNHEAHETGDAPEGGWLDGGDDADDADVGDLADELDGEDAQTWLGDERDLGEESDDDLDQGGEAASGEDEHRPLGGDSHVF